MEIFTSKQTGDFDVTVVKAVPIFKSIMSYCYSVRLSMSTVFKLLILT